MDQRSIKKLEFDKIIALLSEAFPIPVKLEIFKMDEAVLYAESLDGAPAD